MKGFCVIVEFGNDDTDPFLRTEVVGPFRSREVAEKACDRINRRTAKSVDRAADITLAETSRYVRVARFRTATEAINDVNEYMDSYGEEDDSG